MSRAMGQTRACRALPRKMIWEVIDSMSGTRNKAMVAMEFLMGCRKEEMIRLTREDLTREEDFMIVNLPIVKRKEDLRRAMPIPLIDEFLPIVLDHINTIPSGRLFDITGTRFWQLCSAQGITPHELRHSRLTEVAPFFSNDLDIDRYAGWKFPGMKARYVHLRMDHLRDALRLCSVKKDTGCTGNIQDRLHLIPKYALVWTQLEALGYHRPTKDDDGLEK